MSTGQIKIIDNSTNEVLYSYCFEESERAHHKATELEEMGLDISVHIPTVTDTLCDSIGITRDEKEDYEQSIVSEIDDHNH